MPTRHHLIGQTFVAKSGRTRYRVLSADQHRPHLANVEVSVRTTGAWHVTNPSASFTFTAIENNIADGRWTT